MYNEEEQMQPTIVKTSSFFSALLMLAFMAGALLVIPAAAAEVVPEGSLVRSESGTKLYFIENGKRRPIDSPDTLRVQGLSGKVIVITPDELGHYPEGERLTAASEMFFPGEMAVLPDLAPLAADDLSLRKVNGRTLLRFTASFWNRGNGKFELIAHPTAATGDAQADTYQHIIRADGAFRDKFVGNFLWHAPHDHYHFGDFADYVFEPAKEGADARALPDLTRKTTFCMRDNVPIKSFMLAGAPKTRYFAVCSKYRQGVSVGWADVYYSTLPDQFIDVTGVPAGRYRLMFDIDPRGHFLELTKDNNTSIIIIDLDVKAGIMKVVASAHPFASVNNRFPDGMLVRVIGDNGVYIIRGNKKRLLRSAALFEADGYKWDEVYEIPKGVIKAIPGNAVVRAVGSPAIFMLNDGGYRRRILNPGVFSSYGLSASDVAEISAEEFASYPETDLIMRAGDNKVYSLNARKLVGTISSLAGLGYEPASVHVINETDFNAYAVSVTARDLNVPWDIVFLPDGDMLVTERPGTLKRIGKHAATIAFPHILNVGEGGLMGVALHPNFSQNHYIYLYFTTVDDAAKQNRISRFRLEGDGLIDEKVIVDGIPAALYHDGGQVAFGPDGMLYLTTGDAESPALAQNLNTLAGKTLRFTPDGAVPADNPFGTPIWSYGHRNAQGIAWDAQGRLWETEHGRSGALSGLDELNLIEKGKNYGWPTIQGDQMQAGLVTPVKNSGPNYTWAPSGIAYAGDRLFFAGLRGSALYEAVLGADGKITDIRRHLEKAYGRLRAVVVGPDGYLYISTSNRDGRGTPSAGDDKILKVYPEFLR